MTAARAPRRRLWRWLLGVPAAVVLVWAVGMTLVVTLPAVDDPEQADVVMVLGPVYGERMDRAHELLADGVSDRLLVSVGGPGEVGDCWAEGLEYTVTCQRSEPFTTRGELMWLRDEMDENGWDSATLITMPAAVTRTRLIAAQCGLHGLAFVTAGPTLSTRTPWDVVYQSAGFARALIEPEC